MTLTSTQDLLYLIGAICLLWVTGFLCWVMYEIAKLGHQTNELLQDTRDKLARFEEAVLDLSERVSSVTRYLGILAEGGRGVLSFFHHKKEKDAPLPKRGTRK